MKKYELTKETKTFLGKTLYRIRARISFGIVVKGELGGFIESEKNLSVDGNAWVSGNAWVYGNAQVSGNAWVSGNARVYGNARVSGEAQVYGEAQVSPINIIGLDWTVTITDSDMQIGCKFHSHKEWTKFTKSEIAKMGTGATTFWKENKTTLLNLCKRQAKAASKVK